MTTKNYRKITVGDSFSNCIAYVKGANYLNRSVKITDILPSETDGYLDIYVQPVKADAAKLMWKTIPLNQVLEFEYDLNVE